MAASNKEFIYTHQRPTVLEILEDLEKKHYTRLIKISQLKTRLRQQKGAKIAPFGCTPTN